MMTSSTMEMICAFLAGLGGGLLSTVIGHPFDTVKVFQQTSQMKGIIACGRFIIANNGALGLFSGMSLPIISSGLMNSLFFGTYETTARFTEGIFYKRHLTSELRRLRHNPEPYSRINYSNPSIVFASALAGASQIIVGCPVEAIKVKLQAHPKQPGVISTTGSFALARDMFRNFGLVSFYQGTTLMLLREVPSSMVYMYTYQHMTTRLRLYEAELEHYKSRKRKGRLMVPFVAGGIAGTLSALISIPFDVVKSRVQARSYNATINLRLKDHFQSLYQEQGLIGFTRGYKPLLIRAFPINGAAFISYEWFMLKCKSHSIIPK